MRTAEVEVVVPNFKRRLSGVTSSIVQLVPGQAAQIRIAALGPGLPGDLPKLGWRQVPGLLRRPARRRFRIWHARRNVEMLAGVILKSLFRAPVRLVFTSAAQRHHTWLTRFLIRRMDAVIATSGRSGRFLKVPYTVVMHGVDCERFHPPGEAEDGLQGTGLPGRYGVGCFGRIRPQKGTDLFVGAMVRLLPDFPDWTAVIAGRVTAQHREFHQRLLDRISAAGLGERIVFLGEVPDIRPWYRRLRLHVAPSRNEGFGLTPLEAMASRTAVVASDAGAHAEVIAEGRTGAVVPAGDGAALTESMRRYLAQPDLAAAHGRNARAHVESSFSLDNEARGVNAVYDRLWQDSPGSPCGTQSRV